MRKPRTDADRKQLLGKIVQQELETAEGGQSDALQANRANAMSYYNGDLRGDEKEGRSSVVSMDVANVTNAMMAVLREMLILDAELVIDPEGPDDIARAKVESDICSDVLLKDNKGERLILASIKDGLILKNGAAKVVMEGGECRVYSCPIENISFTSGWDGDLQEIPFFAERVLYTRSDLVRMGIPKKLVYELPSGDSSQTATEQARDSSTQWKSDGETPDQDQIECWEAYVMTDMDGDGVAERYRALVANRGTCLEFEETPILPYAMGSPWLSSHRLTGESVYDRIGPIQNSNTLFLRQWHDNVAVINNGRYAYDPSRVNEEDVMKPKAGGGIRATDPLAITPLPVIDVTTGIAMALQYNDRQRSEAAGAALDMSSAEAQLSNKAATVASIEKSNQELVTSMVASNFALTLIVGLYELIHFHLRNFAARPYLANVSGQTVPIDPRQWPERRRMYVRCGMSPSQKATQMQALQMHIQLQTQAMMTGMDGILADANTIYRTGIRWLKLSGVRDAEDLGIDPSSQQAQQAMQSKAQAAQAQQQMMQQLQQMQAQLEQMKIKEDARQHDDDIRFKYWAERYQAQVEEGKMAGQAVIDFEKERLKNENNGEEEAGERAAGNGGDVG